MKMNLGVSGDIGSFSEEAALMYAKRAGINASLIYLLDMEGVLAALDEKKIDQGIFPIINLQGGLVKPAFEAMGKHLFTFFDELWLDVQQCLLTLPHISLNEITQVASHPQGLAQCDHYLEREFKNLPRIEWIDTAKAAKDLSTGALSQTTAVIAPARSAELYGLNIAAKAIQDRKPNLTVFILVKQSEL